MFCFKSNMTRIMNHTFEHVLFVLSRLVIHYFENMIFKVFKELLPMLFILPVCWSLMNDRR